MERNANDAVTEAIAGLKLTTLKAFYATGLDDDGDDTAYWAGIVADQLGEEHYKDAYSALDAHHDVLLSKKYSTAETSHYSPEICPPYRPAGSGPEHSCVSPSTCTDAPDWWEDHCYIYPLVEEFANAHKEMSEGSLANYYAAITQLHNAAVFSDFLWVHYAKGEPLSRAQYRDIMGALSRVDVTTPTAWKHYMAGDPLNRAQVRLITTHLTNSGKDDRAADWADYTMRMEITPAQAQDVEEYLELVDRLGSGLHWAYYSPGSPLTPTQAREAWAHAKEASEDSISAEWDRPSNGALSAAQVRDVVNYLNAKGIDVSTRQVRAWSKRYETLSQRRSDIYSIIGPYYKRMENEVVSKFRGTVATRIEDIKAYTSQALHATISTYRTDKKVPIQAYIRANIPGRVVDRLRMEGIFTRSEGALDKAMRQVAAGWRPGDPIDSTIIEAVANHLGIRVSQVEKTLESYSRKILQHRLEATFDDEGEPTIQVRASEEYEVDHQLERSMENLEIAYLIDRVLEDASPEHREVAEVWLRNGGDANSRELNAFLHRKNMRRATAQSIMRNITAAAKERLAGDGDNWDTYEELVQRVEGN